MPAIAHGHQANDGIDDASAANAILPEPYEFPLERIPTLGIGGNGSNGRLGREGKGEDVKRKT